MRGSGRAAIKVDFQANRRAATTRKKKKTSKKNNMINKLSLRPAGRPVSGILDDYGPEIRMTGRPVDISRLVNEHSVSLDKNWNFVEARHRELKPSQMPELKCKASERGDRGVTRAVMAGSFCFEYFFILSSFNRRRRRRIKIKQINIFQLNE